MSEFGESKLPRAAIEKQDENFNSISELLSFGNGIETTSDKVYRSVNGEEALHDLFASGAVRNKHVAHGGESQRWGQRVFWSRGQEGKKHAVQNGAYVLETTYAVAKDRMVKSEDIIAIWTKNQDGTIVDVLPLFRGV